MAAERPIRYCVHMPKKAPMPAPTTSDTTRGMRMSASREPRVNKTCSTMQEHPLPERGIR